MDYSCAFTHFVHFFSIGYRVFFSSGLPTICGVVIVVSFNLNLVCGTLTIVDYFIASIGSKKIA